LITVAVFWVLAAIDVGLLGYAFVDHHNRLYGNVFASGISIILSFLLALNIMGGTVGEIRSVANTTSVNGTTVYGYVDLIVPIRDSSIGYLFAFIGILALIMTVVFVIGAVRENLGGGDDEDY
jgi:hypothetical protein